MDSVGDMVRRTLYQRINMENMTECANCGHDEDSHIDNTDQCFIVGCTCKEFEPYDPDISLNDYE